jgi:hypothetical protein
MTSQGPKVVPLQSDIGKIIVRNLPFSVSFSVIHFSQHIFSRHNDSTRNKWQIGKSGTFSDLSGAPMWKLS